MKLGRKDKRSLKVNTGTASHRMIQCAMAVNKEHVRRETINGVEHIIVQSATLPDDVVMNGGLYPAEEITKSFHSLERTLAPIEHPVDANGDFISASDPEAIHNFHAGAFNMNVKRGDGIITLEKHINVQEAMKTERGKRLLDRINELETSDKPRPIHTSTGVFLAVEQLDKPQTNSAGEQYSWIAREMVFDHDAILLDSVAAATPDKGVGMAVNFDGKKLEVDRVIMANKDGQLKQISANVEGMSQSELTDQLQKSIQGIVGAEWMYVVDVFEDVVIFETNQGLFEVPYRVDQEIASIVGIPMRVDRVVSYEPKINSAGDAMKEMILNALKKAGIQTEGLSDDQLFAEFSKLQANQQRGEGEGEGQGEGQGQAANQSQGDLAEVVANALKPVTDELKSLKSQINAQADAERQALVEVVVNSDKYPGIDEEAAKALPLDSLKAMAANCASAHGIPFTMNASEADDGFSAPAEMPN